MTLVDLTHPLGPGAHSPPGSPALRIEELPCPPGAVLRDSVVELVVHAGTHVDAPSHLIGHAQHADELPLDALIGPAVAWGFDCAEPREIGARELQAARPEARAGDQVYLHTGWDRFYGDEERYAAHPHVSAEAAAWLVERGVSLVAIDTPTPDLAVAARPEGFDFPVHRALLGAGVPIVENVAGLGAVAGRRFRGHVCAIPLVGADGAPARVFAELGEASR
jgi:arylformamidase